MKKNITAGDTDSDKKPEKGKFKKTELIGIIAGASGIGFYLIVPLVGGAFLGSYLDSKFDSAPKITLSLIFFGLFIGLYTMYKAVKDLLSK